MTNIFCRFWAWIKSLFWKHKMELTVVGMEFSGKTSFVNVISDGRFYEDMIPTVGFNVRSITKGNVEIKIWDLGGQARFRSMWYRYCRGVNAIIFMVDAADEKRFEGAKEEFKQLVNKTELEGIPILVLANKKDLPNAIGEMELIELMQLNEINDREICCYSISCKERHNIDITLQWLLQHANLNGGSKKLN